MPKDNFTCIIPFYNEGLRPLEVVSSVTRVKGISKIIVVDDGSKEDTTYLELRSRFPRIISIRLEKNSGKSNAIKEGLNHTNTEYVLLLDGDLANVKSEELENAIQKMTNNPSIDMIILRRVEDETSTAWARQDIVTSGQRLLRRDDLTTIFQCKFTNYQLEVAINTFMVKNKKLVYWMPFSIHNTRKWEKWGWWVGWKRGLKMMASFLSYAGWSNFFWQTLFFCRKEAP